MATRLPAWLDHSPDAALWNHAAAKQVFAQLRANSVVVGGQECTLASTARRLNAAIIVGLHERVEAGPGHGTLYNSVVLFQQDGRLAVHHRKLVPTFRRSWCGAMGMQKGCAVRMSTAPASAP